jgi:hypothetical protein
MGFDWGNAICVVIAMGMFVIAAIPFMIFVIALKEKRNFK